MSDRPTTRPGSKNVAEWSPARDNHGEETGLGAQLRYILALVRRDIKVIALIVFGFIAIALAVTMLTTPRYTAVATVQINDQSDEVLGEDLDTQTTSNVGWDIQRFLNTQLEILRSREIAERVVRSLDLANDEAFFAASGMDLSGEPVSDKVREDIAVAVVRGGLAVDLPYETRIASISYTIADPEYASKIANAFAEQFIQSSLQRRYDSSGYARRFIADQLDEARVRLEASERELNSYARQAGLIRPRGSLSDADSGGSGSVTSESLAQLNRAANDARAKRVETEALWRAEMAQPLMSSPSVTQNATIQSLIGRRAAIDAELEKLRLRYLDDYPPIAELSAERRELDKQIADLARSVRGGVKAQYDAAVAAENTLRGQVDALQDATLAEQDRSVRYNTLAREADTNRSIYDGLLQRYRTLNAAAGISNSNLSIIDTARTPSAPSSPNLLKNVLIALIVGFAAAALFVFLRDQFDDAIRIPEDVETKIKLPLLGVIPEAVSSDPSEDLRDPKSPLAEAYNSLRGQLLYSTADGLPKIVQITSAQPSEGKTTTSNAVAMGFARMGKKVVLVDADLRRPNAHKRHGLANKHGLSGLLTGAEELGADNVHEVAPNLSVITSGPIPPSPTELLSGPRLGALLEDLAERYELVVLDSPPVLGLADAPVISGLADGVVVVIESNRGRGGMLKTALNRLRAMEPVLLGAVLTKFDPKNVANSYSEYYGYEYYHYSSADSAER